MVAFKLQIHFRTAAALLPMFETYLLNVCESLLYFSLLSSFSKIKLHQTLPLIRLQVNVQSRQIDKTIQWVRHTKSNTSYSLKSCLIALVWIRLASMRLVCQGMYKCIKLNDSKSRCLTQGLCVISKIEIFWLTQGKGRRIVKVTICEGWTTGSQ